MKKNKDCFDKKLILIPLFLAGLLFIFKDEVTNDNDNKSCDCD